MSEKNTSHVAEGIDNIAKLLLDRGIVDQEQMKQAQDMRVSNGVSLGRALVDLGYVAERNLIDFISSELNIASIDLASFTPDKEAIDLVPAELAKRYRFVPLFKIENTLTIAMADPMNVFAIDDIRFQVGCDIEPMISTEADIMRAIASNYGTDVFVQEAMDNAEIQAAGIVSISESSGADKLEQAAEQAPIVKLVNEILNRAIHEHSSDIHIEPEEYEVNVRYRIDGVLTQVSSAPKNLQLPIVSRIKVMSDLDLVERRVPQDGRMQVAIENRKVDIRVSMYPAVHGEKVVLRILDQSKMVTSIDKIGFSERDFKEFTKLIRRPNGIVLVTGPTGSGKSSTLYAALLSIDLLRLNVMTIEDPVEYRLSHVTQGQVNEKVDFTFSSALRSMLRQDPDVIMVGEIRDFETAELAIRAALTGHLVLSTLHTNSAPAAITRLVDMGIEPFLIASATAGIQGQRLVRRICSQCKEPVNIEPVVIERLGANIPEGAVFYHGKGCPYCRQTGYRGRLAIFELLLINDTIRQMIVQKVTTDEIAMAAEKAGMKNLRQDGVEKALQGLTTIDEVLRVTED